MAKRSERKRRAHQGQRVTVTSVAPGEGGQAKVGLQISTAHLPRPDAQFYSNGLRVHPRRNYVSFLFVQFAIGSSRAHNAVSIDIPYVTIGPIVGTFDASFREVLGAATKNLQSPEPAGFPDHPGQVFSYPAHVARVVVNELAGVVDFYDINPIAGAPLEVEPVIRIKTFPATVRAFVEECDKLAAELKGRAGAEAPNKVTP